MRALYKNWLRILLTEKNPYTNIALKDDPALAILQLQNEDSLFFWTFDTMSDSQKRTLGTQYGAWLTKKYGSLDGAQKFWATGDKASSQNDAAVTVQGDDWRRAWWRCIRRGNSRRPQTWRQKSTPQSRPDAVSGDHDARVQRRHREVCARPGREMPDQLDELASRRHAAHGRRRALGLCANPVLAVNRYTGSVHEGKDNGWAIRAGDFYDPSWSQLKDPAGFPLTLKPALGSPMLVTESSWTLPTLHRAKARSWCPRMARSRESGRISSSSTPTTNGRSRHRRTATTRTHWSSGRTPNR
jgi:hypothetical protein